MTKANIDYAVTVSGFAALQRAVGRIEDGTKAELRQRLRAIGDQVALVAASDAPRLTGELQNSIKSSVTARGASIYSTSVYGGAQNFGAWEGAHKGPHIKRASASHYMDRAVSQLAPWVEQETNGLIDWVISTLEGN